MKFRATYMLALVGLAFLVTTIEPVQAALSEESLKWGFRDYLIRIYCRNQRTPFCLRYNIAALADVKDDGNDITGDDFDEADFEDLSDSDVAALLDAGFFNRSGPRFNNGLTLRTICKDKKSLLCIHVGKILERICAWINSNFCARNQIAALVDAGEVDEDEDLDDEDFAALVDAGLFRNPRFGGLRGYRSRFSMGAILRAFCKGKKTALCAKYNSATFVDASDIDEDEDMDDEDFAALVDAGFFPNL